MTPAEALSLLQKGDPDGIVPPLYRHMSEVMLRALMAELGPPPPTIETCSVGDLLERAIARPERLCSPARRRVAFLQHFARCRTLVVAAACTGIDRRTVNRWRAASPVFDRRVRELMSDRREDAVEYALLVASRPRMRPVFYRGVKVGEYEVPNNALALYLLKRADGEADRAEKTSRSAPPKKGYVSPNGEFLEEAFDRVARLRRGEWPEKREPDSRDMSHQSPEMSRFAGQTPPVVPTGL